MNAKMNSINNQQGYTLLEMLIVLSVLGMIGLIILPLYSASAAKQEIEHAIKQFEEDYFYVQQKAITESKTFRIITNSTINQSRYSVQELEANGRTYSDPLFTRLLPEQMIIRKVTGSGNHIKLKPTGHIEDVGTIAFTYELEGKSHRRNYIFQVHTGRFRIEHFSY